MRSYVKARSLRRIFRYLTKHRIPVHIKYQYNNSMNIYMERQYGGIIRRYEIIRDEVCGYFDLRIKITFEDGSKMEEDISEQWYYAHGTPNEVIMVYDNWGIPCYFIIERKDQV